MSSWRPGVGFCVHLWFWMWGGVTIFIFLVSFCLASPALSALLQRIHDESRVPSLYLFSIYEIVTFIFSDLSPWGPQVSASVFWGSNNHYTLVQSQAGWEVWGGHGSGVQWRGFLSTSCGPSKTDTQLGEPSSFLLLPPCCLSRPADTLRSVPPCSLPVPGHALPWQKPHLAALVGRQQETSLELLKGRTERSASGAAEEKR